MLRPDREYATLIKWALYGHVLSWIPIIEWYMARPGVKRRHQKDMCHDEIGLCARNLDTILGSIVNIIIVRAYVTTQRERSFTLTSYNFCNYMRQILIGFNGEKCLWS